MNPLYQINNDNPAVKAAVQYITGLFSAAGIPVSVTYNADQAFFPMGTGWVSYTVTFAAEGKSYTAISGLLAYYASISVTEMRSYGLLPK